MYGLLQSFNSLGEFFNRNGERLGDFIHFVALQIEKTLDEISVNKILSRQRLSFIRE
jgi:hypothetical protein